MIDAGVALELTLRFRRLNKRLTWRTSGSLQRWACPSANIESVLRGHARRNLRQSESVAEHLHFNEILRTSELAFDASANGPFTSFQPTLYTVFSSSK